MKFFQWNKGGDKTPSAPGRNMVKSGYAGDKAHVVSDETAYVAAQIQQVIEAILPFDPSPICAKCQSPAIATEHGSRYYVPQNPDDEQVTTRYIDTYSIGPSGSYHVGPEYLLRSCTVCQFAWVEHTADTQL